MGRRKKTSAAEDVIDLVARLPWWLGIGLAIVAYLYFHSVASTPALTELKPGQAASFVLPTFWKAVSGALQYIAPLLCLGGAAASAYRRHSRKQLLANATASEAAGVIDRMTWQQFEQLVGEAFRRQGFKVAELGGAGPDGGVDLVLTKGAERHLVQCKQWRAYKVGVDVVRELYGVMAAQGAAGGFVVTSGRFTDEARGFAAGRNVSLIDGASLGEFLRLSERQAGASAPSTTSGAAPATSARPRKAEPAASVQQAPTGPAPACPKCGTPMVRRVARQGANAGSAFWGCSDFPRCRGTMPIAD